MGDFANYIKNIGYTAIVDVVMIIALAVVMLIFFKKRNSVKMAIVYSLFFLAYIAVSVICAKSEQSILYVTKRLLDYLLIFMITAFVVVYQTDLKQIAARLGRFNDKSKNYDLYNNTDEDLKIAAGEIVKACQNMAKKDTGALIVIAPTNVPSHILDTGTELRALVSSGLLESIFNTKSPLHDGAVVIKGNCVLAAGCFLTLSQNTSISKELGTRHRAAIGVTEESDVLAIVVSEETGVISVVSHGVIKRYMTPDKLYEQLEIAYGINYKMKKRDKY